MLSTGRTGTTTLARLLGLSEEVLAYHEPVPELLEERKTARWEIRRKPKKYTHIFAWARGRSLLRAVSNSLMYAETSPRLTYFAPVIADLLPRSKFLFIHREPSEVVRSGMKRGWYDNHPNDYARVHPVEGEPFFGKWDKLKPFEKICWYWKKCNEFAIEFRSKLESSRVHTIKSSNLFDGTAVSEIFEFAGIPKPPKKSVKKVLEKKLNAQKEGEYPKAKNWSTKKYKKLVRIAEKIMIELGYFEKYQNPK